MSPIEQRQAALGARENTADQPTESQPTESQPTQSPPTQSPQPGPSPPTARHNTPSPPAAAESEPALSAGDGTSSDEETSAGSPDSPGAGNDSGSDPGSDPGKPKVRTKAHSHRLLGFVAVVALLMSVAAVSVIGVGIYHYRTMLSQPTDVGEEDEDSSTQRAGLSPSDDDDDERSGVGLASMDGLVQTTRTVMRGTVEVVDVGVAATTLLDVLRAQRIVADTKDQTLVFMITGRGCEPCEGFDAAISDPLMQRALDGVRLVRVDREVFKDELKSMDLPTNVFPAFFLLAEDLRPVDAIHGGEWDEDIAKNIAPVMDPFVRGELRHRRHPDWAPTTSSISI